jgi:Lrp/AsnC family leucine-responsive transcriptional regulator
MKILDDTDRKLIALLQDNARLPTIALAKAVGLGRSTVQERLQRLEAAGVIAQYTVRLGAGDPLQAWLLLRYDEGYSCDDLLPRLAPMPEIQQCHSVAGEIDLLILARTDTPAQLSDLRERIVRMPGVADVTTLMVLKTLVDRG